MGSNVSIKWTDRHDQLVVPLQERKHILTDIHSGASGGHLGSDKMMSRVKARFYWAGYWKDVQNWCRTCSVCASRKSPIPRNQAPLQSIFVHSPMQLVAVDILGPLPQSAAGNSYVLVAADYFTKWVEVFPIPNQEASTVAKKLVDQLFCRFSVPQQLHSDQGRQFEASVITEICKILHIEKTHTTPYHPQSDGLVERFNRTLNSMLATCVDEHPSEWEDHIHKVCMAYNTSQQSTTGFSPFYLMFGREARIPVDLWYDLPDNCQILSHTQYAQNLQRTFRKAYSLVRERVSFKHRRQQEIYNKKVHGKPYVKGELVWLFNPAITRGKSKKFHRPWTGPYQVINQLSPRLYKIRNVKNRKTTVVHFDRLKLCPSDMRFPSPSNSPHMLQTADQQPTSNQELELIDDDAPPTTDDAPPTTDDAPPTTGDLHTSQAQTLQSSARYPHRPHHPPNCFGDLVPH